MKALLLAALTFLPTTNETEVQQESQEVASIIETAVEDIIGILRNKELSKKERRAKSMDIVEPLIDFKLLGMLSLGKKGWGMASETQRDEFVDLFARTLKHSYFEKLLLFTDEEVEFEAPELVSSKGSPKYSVQSFIISKGERIKVGYEVTRRDGKWKVFDFEIEGVSVRKSYGSQYTDFLREKSLDQLLETMREKVEEADKQAAEADSSN
ncbi:MAG: phospholipid transport system substrate-binding protein [Planctomycetota bacterium]|jgi:phospholipid transport system substrate-binding protein